MGFTLRGTPQYTEPIEKSMELLPTCVMAEVEKGGLHSITVVKHTKLGHKNVAGRDYIVQADSFFRTGNVYIDIAYVDNPVVVLHEMGHWWERRGLDGYWEAWTMAVKADYAELSPGLQYDNAYLKDPEEAWAELFAYHFLGDNGYGHRHHYRVARFPRSNAMMAMILQQSCN